MATGNEYNLQHQSEYAAYAPLRKQYDVTFDSNGSGPLQCRAVMVTEEATITGEFAEQPGETKTTPTLLPGVIYPFVFTQIFSVSAGSVKVYF